MTGKEVILAPVLGTLTATSWAPPDELTQEKWRQCVKQIAHMHKASAWWLGDVWACGEGRKWGAGQEFADEIGVDYGAITTYAWVCRKISIRIENLSFGHHHLVASLDPDEQENWLERAAIGGWSVRDMRLELYRGRKQQRHAGLSNASATSFGQPFPLIYADPPWPYETHSDLGKVMTSPDNHYPTMTVEQICDLMVGDKHITEIIADDCALFLWCTSANLICMAQQVWERWGFEYSTHAVWDKQRTGTGLIFRNQHEVLVYARRGNMPGPLYLPPSVFSYPRGKHSAKPPEIRQALEKMYPAFGEQDRLELFARGKVPGWSVWGDEAEPAPTIPLSPASNVVPVDAQTEASVKELFLQQAQKRHKAFRVDRALKWRARQQP
jgi:N6-adenosine-specific RNA methylase IME4